MSMLIQTRSDLIFDDLRSIVNSVSYANGSLIIDGILMPITIEVGIYKKNIILQNLLNNIVTLERYKL
jgi:hypothetical protein